MTMVGGVPYVVLVVLAAGVLILLAGVSGAGKSKLAHLAIMTAFKAGREVVGQGLGQVSAQDLAVIAHSTYAAWPAVLLVGPVPVPVGLLKTFVSENAWVALVEKEYTAFAAYYEQVMSTAPGSLGGNEVANTVKAITADAQTVGALKRGAQWAQNWQGKGVSK